MYVTHRKYIDYDGNEREEDFYFNLTKAECLELEMSVSGGLKKQLETIIKSQDAPKIMETFKKIILLAYGEKSPDGKRFIKSEELSRAFTQTEAYSDMIMEFATDDGAAAKFINATLPRELQQNETPATIAAKN